MTDKISKLFKKEGISQNFLDIDFLITNLTDEKTNHKVEYAINIKNIRDFKRCIAVVLKANYETATAISQHINCQLEVGLYSQDHEVFINPKTGLTVTADKVVCKYIITELEEHVNKKIHDNLFNEMKKCPIINRYDFQHILNGLDELSFFNYISLKKDDDISYEAAYYKKEKVYNKAMINILYRENYVKFVEITDYIIKEINRSYRYADLEKDILRTLKFKCLGLTSELTFKAAENKVTYKITFDIDFLITNVEKELNKQKDVELENKE